MNTKTITILVGVATVLMVPAMAGAQGWSSWLYEGNAEPNVAGWDDATANGKPAWMWPSANQDGEDKIYFDAIVSTWSWPFGAPVVPNANPDGFATRNYGGERFHAYLGVWRDCNGDNFIGDAATGRSDVPAEQARVQNPNADAICPPNSPYQDDVWMREFLAIGPGQHDISGGAQNEQFLCPDRTGGPSGNTDFTPRTHPDEGVLDNDGNNDPDENDKADQNIVCTGARNNFVHDDFAKVWHDFGLPVDQPGQSALLLPFPDGFMRDTNGHFRYVDQFTFNAISDLVPGLWPAPGGNNDDPAQGNNCAENGGDGLAAGAIVDGAVEGAEATSFDPGAVDVNPTSPRDSTTGLSGACSPAPNVSHFGFPAPIGDVGWPGHTAEDRYNNSENPNSQGTAYTAPFDEGGPDSSDRDNYDEDAEASPEEPVTGGGDCELKGNPDDWDNNRGDGDPLFGYNLEDSPTDLSAYYGPDDDGPSLIPTGINVYSRVLYEAEKAQSPDTADCNHQDPVGVYGGNFETAGTAGNKGTTKNQADSTFIFVSETTFNPSTAPGGPSPDAETCIPAGPLSQHPIKCDAFWRAPVQYLVDAGVLDLSPSPDATRISTFYADVSFGTPSFDMAGDGTFSAKRGYFEGPLYLDSNGELAEWTIDASKALPQGDDHWVYGDEQCDSISSLTDGTGTDEFESDGPIAAVAGLWDCNRQEWANALNLDCNGDDSDEPEVAELICYLAPKPGDTYDLRDVECHDNDVAGQDTSATRDCDTLAVAPTS